MEIKTLRNGLTKSKNCKRRTGKRRAKRRNPSTAAPRIAAPKAKPRARRNGISKSSVAAYAKKNGLKVVKASANRKRHKRRRRNGITATPRASRNGLLGNTKHDAMQIAYLGGGALATNLVGNFVGQFAAPYLASFGVGSYTELIAKGFVAIAITPYVAGMISKNADLKKMARLGGLLVVALEAVNQFFPQININPFNNAPIVINSNGQALLTAQGATSLAAAAGVDANAVAKMAGAIEAATGGSQFATYQQPMQNAWAYSDGFSD